MRLIVLLSTYFQVFLSQRRRPIALSIPDGAWLITTGSWLLLWNETISPRFVHFDNLMAIYLGTEGLIKVGILRARRCSVFEPKTHGPNICKDTKP